MKITDFKENEHFQGISCITFQRSFTVHYDCMKKCGFWENCLFLVICMKYMHFNAPLIGYQNEQISMDFQKTAFYRLQFLYRKLPIFRNEHISVKLQISVIPMDFQKRAFRHLVYLYQKSWILGKLSDFHKINRFQWNQKKYQILPNFQKTAF